MGWFDGFPFTSNKERARRRKNFEKRIAPFGVEPQREKVQKTLHGLFPGIDDIDVMFAFFDAKDAYTKAAEEEAEAEDGEEVVDGCAAACVRLQKHKWMDEHKEQVMLRFIELESKIPSLDEFPTADDVYASLGEA